MKSLLGKFFLGSPTRGRRAIRSRPTSIAHSILSKLLPFWFKNASRRMDIRKDNLQHEAVELLQNIADSHFIAFDFEFSGVEFRDRTREGKPNLQEHYLAVRDAVHKFQPLQIGLTIAKVDPRTARYVLEPYNFNISPVPAIRERIFQRTWSMQSGAVSFLQRNGFDFHTQFLTGVPYLSWHEEREARANMLEQAKRVDMDIKDIDKPFVQYIRDEITKWQALPKDQQSDYLNIPNIPDKGEPPSDIPTELNRFQMRLVHQTVENEFPAMKTRGMTGFVQITNPTDEQQAGIKELELQQRERDLARAIGLRWILDGMTGHDISRLPEDWLSPALSDVPSSDHQATAEKIVKSLVAALKQRNKVLIGHNCFTDLLFLYKLIAGPLPDTLAQFCDSIHDMFPAIIDTKYLAMSYHEKYGRSALGDVERELRDQKVPDIYTSSSFSRYIDDAYLHEAGYDSYITAIVAIKLASRLHKEGSAKKKKEQERQATGLESAAKAQPPEFGLQDTYKLAPDCKNANDPAASSITQAITSRLPTLAGITSHFAGASPAKPEPPTSNPEAAAAPEVVAVRTSIPVSRLIPASLLPITVSKSDPPPTITTSALTSKFASATLYSSLPDDTASMPGEAALADASPSETELHRKMNRMVAQGEMMPRWDEERAFWEFYGNRLQMNGTSEGSLHITEHI